MQAQHVGSQSLAMLDDFGRVRGTLNTLRQNGLGRRGSLAVLAAVPGLASFAGGSMTGSDQIQHNAEPILNLAHRRWRHMSPVFNKALLGDDLNLLR